MSLEELLASRTVYKVVPNKGAALNLAKMARKDTGTAERLLELGELDWAFAIAYNAMLRSARAYMLRLGYRPAAAGGHVAVIRFLGEKLRDRRHMELVDAMDDMRKKRHELVYEEPEIVAEEEARYAIDLSKRFVKEITALI